MYAAKCNNGKVEMYPCHGVNAFYYSVQWDNMGVHHTTPQWNNRAEPMLAHYT